LLDQVADAPIEALYHAIGLRMAGRRQAVHDTCLITADIKRVFACGASTLGCKKICELTPVVSEDFLNSHGRDFSQSAQKIGTADDADALRGKAATAQTAHFNGVRMPKTRAILGVMRLNFLSV
jgi:hypothetical protein